MMTTPDNDFQELIKMARKEFLSRELGRRGKVNTLLDPYWYEESLIEKSKALLQAGDPLRAHGDCLREYNHGHSGFTSASIRIYMHPLDDRELEVSLKIRGMILRIAEALIHSEPLSKDMQILGDGWMTVTAIYHCLVLLGKKVPPGLVRGLRGILADCHKFKSKNKEVENLQATFKDRFG